MSPGGRGEVTSGTLASSVAVAEIVSHRERRVHSVDNREGFDHDVADHRLRARRDSHRLDRDLERLISPGPLRARGDRNRPCRRVHLGTDVPDRKRSQTKVSMPSQRYRELGRRDGAEGGDAPQTETVPPAPETTVEPPS